MCNENNTFLPVKPGEQNKVLFLFTVEIEGLSLQRNLKHDPNTEAYSRVLTPRPPGEEALPQGVFGYLMQMRHHLSIHCWHCRFGPEQGKPGRGRLTGLDVQIRTPVYEESRGWGGAASVRPPPHLAAGGGTGFLCSLLAERHGCEEAEGWCTSHLFFCAEATLWSHPPHQACSQTLSWDLRKLFHAEFLRPELKTWWNQAHCWVYRSTCLSSRVF